MSKPELPDLPDKYFWRITKFGIDNPSPLVELRKKTIGPFSRKIRGLFNLDFDGPVHKEVEDLAHSILAIEKLEEERRSEVWEIMGDYND